MNNCKNLEITKTLKDTMELNVVAIDYIFNEIRHYEDRLHYNPKDEEAQYALRCLKYINFSLYYLDKQYMQAFRKAGGKI